MDIISYGVASKAAKKESDARTNVLGQGVEGIFPHAKGRMDKLEDAIQGIVGQADKMIVNNAVNIMKEHAKFNTVAKSTQYKMHNMVFEDFLGTDAQTGATVTESDVIDTANSVNHVWDGTLGEVGSSDGVNPYTVVTPIETVSASPEKVILTVEEKTSSYSSDVTPAMTTNTSASPYVAEDYPGSGGGYSATEAWRAFSHDNNCWWHTDHDAKLQIDFGGSSNAKPIGKYAITGEIHHFPKSWKLIGLDGTSWVTLDEVTGEANWADGEKREFFIDSPKNCHVYQLIMIETGTNTDVRVRELELMEAMDNSQLKGVYSISRDGGATWETITPETLHYFDQKNPAGTSLVLKAELPAGTKLLNYGLTWV